LGLDAGHIQPSESTIEKYPRAEDNASDDELPQKASRKSVVSFRKRKHLCACIDTKGGHLEYNL